MRAELTSQQEEFLLEQARERYYETKQAREEQGKTKCEFCKELVDEVSKVKIEGGEICFICEGCKEELESEVRLEINTLLAKSKEKAVIGR